MKSIREPIDVVDLIVRDLAKEVRPATVRRVLRSAFLLTAYHLQHGESLLLRDVGVVCISTLRPRVVKCNLPHLRGKVYKVRRTRYRLKIKPHGRTADFLRRQAVCLPGRRVTGGPEHNTGAEGSGNM